MYNVDVSSFDVDTTLQVWQNVTSAWISDFYNVNSYGYGGTTETGEAVFVLKVKTEFKFWYFEESAYSMNNQTQTQMQRMLMSQEACHAHYSYSMWGMDDVHRHEKASLDTLHIYYTNTLRFQMANADESSVSPKDIVTFPFAGGVYRTDYLRDYLRGSNHSAFQFVSAMTHVLFRPPPKVTEIPSASPTNRPSSVPSASPTYTLLQPEDTWAEIQVTIVVSAGASAICLIVFELCRRLPVTADVFDRRRATKPDNTPPPLIKRRRFFEWLIVSTDPAYTIMAANINDEDAEIEAIRKGIRRDEVVEDKIIEEPLPNEVSGKGRTDDDDEVLSHWSDDSYRNDDATDAFSRKGAKTSLSHTRIQRKIVQVTCNPTDDDLEMLESGKTLEDVKRERKRILGMELVPGKIDVGGKSVPSTRGEKAITGQLRDDLDASGEKRGSSKKKSRGLRSSFSFVTRRVGQLKNKSHAHQSKVNKGRLNHLGTSAVGLHRNLNPAERELLRCVGLDTFVMLRFLKFGFDVSFYSSLVGCIMLVPMYAVDFYDGGATKGGSGVATVGYYEITMNKLEPESHKYWVVWVYAIGFFVFVLWRLYIEWEIFIVLRFDFLAANKCFVGMDEVKMEQYRNSCLVEHIPPHLRSDCELYEYFDSIFPGQVKRAEVLVTASELTELIAERQRNIELYEDTYAKQVHLKNKYKRQMEAIKKREGNISIWVYFCNCLRSDPQKPTDPMVNISEQFCGKALVKALPHYLSEIKRLNRLINEEADRLLSARMKIHSKDKDKKGSLLTGLVKEAIPLAEIIDNVVDGDYSAASDTGFVEFMNCTTKESALQCNISGTSEFVTCRAAPTPDDILWENAAIEQKGIKKRKNQMYLLLVSSLLFWTTVVATIGTVTEPGSTFIPESIMPEEGSQLEGLFNGLVPVLLLEALMLAVIFVLDMIAMKYIRFKTKSEAEEFVFLWHFNFRLVNLLALIVAGGVSELWKEREDVTEATELLVDGVADNSQFFLDNMIVGAGPEALFELSQMLKIVSSFFILRFVSVEGKSQRSLEKFEETEQVAFGELVPNFIFAFMSACIYFALAPIVNFAVAIYFIMNYKVFHHQALFVYAQKHDGGGRIMYLLNRMIFVTLYVSIVIFFSILTLKGAPAQATTFFYSMALLTLVMDFKIQQTFVQPSATLALLKAREIDEQTKVGIDAIFI